MQEMQETQVQSVGQEHSLEKEMAIHSNILAWKIPMDRGAWRATVQRVANNWTRLSTHMGYLRIKGDHACKTISLQWLAQRNHLINGSFQIYLLVKYYRIYTY